MRRQQRHISPFLLTYLPAFLLLVCFGRFGNAWTTSSTAWRQATGIALMAQNEDKSESHPVVDRRQLVATALQGVLTSAMLLSSKTNNIAWAMPTIDVNNALAREFTAFPGLYPTIATKIVNAAKEKPFTSKKDVYAALENDLQKERLKQYDAAIVIKKPDKAVQQFKTSQICKYECGGRTSSAYRDEQIKEVQRLRSLDIN